MAKGNRSWRTWIRSQNSKILKSIFWVSRWIFRGNDDNPSTVGECHMRKKFVCFGVESKVRRTEHSFYTSRMIKDRSTGTGLGQELLGTPSTFARVKVKNITFTKLSLIWQRLTGKVLIVLLSRSNLLPVPKVKRTAIIRKLFISIPTHRTVLDARLFSISSENALVNLKICIVCVADFWDKRPIFTSSNSCCLLF